MSRSRKNRGVSRWLISGCSLLAAICFVFTCSVLSPTSEASLAQSERDSNWSFSNSSISDRGTGELESRGESSSSPSILTDDSGAKYASNRLLLTIDGSVDEQELREVLSEDGVRVEQISLVSNTLDNNEVLVLVEYEGDEDPAGLGERLAESSVVASAEVDQVLGVDDTSERITLEPSSTSANAAADDEGAGVSETEVDEVTLENAAEEQVVLDEHEAEVVAIEEEIVAEVGEEGIFFDEWILSPQATVNDSYFSKQWELAAAKLSKAWDYSKSSGAVTVAVIDTGVDCDHVDLANNMVPSSYFKNTYTGATGVAAVEDIKGHGTHVAGIIAAQANNSKGVAGVSYNAKILPIKVAHNSEGAMYSSDIIEAIDYVVSLKNDSSSPAALKNLRVINMSLGGVGPSSTSFQNAINRATNAGILCVASAGNDASYNTDYYPAAYDGVLAVAALKKTSTGVGYAVDKDYSNYGPYVDISAPGTKIYSTTVSNSYGYKTGTSMAAPVVSGAAALLYAQNMNLKPADVMFLLQKTAVDLEASGCDNRTGYGAVNAYYAAYSRPIAYCTFSAIPDQKYTGSAVKPKVTVKYGNTTLAEGTDYTLSYSNNVNVGKATVIVTGKGRSAGSATLSFNIRKQANMSGVTFNSATYTYDGEPHYLAISGSLPSGVSVYYQNNGKVNVGKYTVIARFIADTSVYLPISDRGAALTINPASVLDCWLYSIPEQPYTGKAIEPDFSLYLGEDYKLKEGTDYVVSYEENIEVGKASAYVTGVGNFKGQGRITFEIVPSISRLYGGNALETMTSIVREGFADGSASGRAVVVATMDGYWDALAASSLAGANGTPVLLTDPSSLSPQTRAEIVRLGATRVYIAGGTAAVSSGVESELRSLVGASNVERLAGDDARRTAVRIYDEGAGSWGGTAFVATSDGYWDALAASPYAYAQGAPVFLTDPSTKMLDPCSVEAIRAGGFDRVVLCGGTAVVSEGVRDQLAGIGVTRLGGGDAYETAAIIAGWCLGNGMGAATVGVATGSGYWDALTGASLCGVRGGPLVLVGGGTDDAASFLAANRDDVMSCYVFGGPAAVTGAEFDAVRAALG